MEQLQIRYPIPASKSPLFDQKKKLLKVTETNEWMNTKLCYAFDEMTSKVNEQAHRMYV